MLVTLNRTEVADVIIANTQHDKQFFGFFLSQHSVSKDFQVGVHVSVVLNGSNALLMNF